MSNESIVRVPVVATRGIILFPGLDSMIEVGRTKSINAVNTSSQSYDSMVWVVCQNGGILPDPDRYRCLCDGRLCCSVLLFSLCREACSLAYVHLLILTKH